MKQFSLASLMVLSLCFFSCSKSCLEEPAVAPTAEPICDPTPFSKLFGGANNDDGHSTIKTPDGGYLIVGLTKSIDGDMADPSIANGVCLIKVDAKGEKVWVKALANTYPNLHEGCRIPIKAASDGGYVIGCIGKNSFDALLIKVSSDGEELWRKVVSQCNGALALAATEDGYAMVGNFMKAGVPMGVGLIITDLSGNVLKESSLKGSDFAYEAPTCIIPAPDNGYIIGAMAFRFPRIGDPDGSESARVIKVDANGAKQWDKEFRGTRSDWFKDATVSADGGYILVGNTTSNDLDMAGLNHGFASDVLAVKLDANGNRVWLKLFGGAASEYGYSIRATDDGNYLIAGSAASSDGDVSRNQGGQDAWMFKINESGAILNQVVLGGTKEDRANFIYHSDCSYIVIGTTTSNDGDVTNNHKEGASDIWIGKYEL